MACGSPEATFQKESTTSVSQKEAPNSTFGKYFIFKKQFYIHSF
jgi:hypothetical protein